jgi:hypothetical protein
MAYNCGKLVQDHEEKFDVLEDVLEEKDLNDFEDHNNHLNVSFLCGALRIFS